jgi:hypothetical protein
MGTRSTTTIKNEDGKVLVTIYVQYDGYPDGLGQELADFLSSRTVINGFGTETATNYANGMGCLAAQLIGHLKSDQIGNVYITREGDSQEYNYTVYLKDKELYLRCDSEYYGHLYDGLARDYNGSVVSRIQLREGAGI